MTEKVKQTFEIETKSVVKILLLIFGFILVLRFLSLELHILTLILTAAFFAVALNPAVSWLSKKIKSKSRVRATAVAYLAVVIVLAGFVTVVVPPLARQTIDFARTVPDNIETFQNGDTALSRFVREHDLGDSLNNIGTNIRDNTFNYKKPFLDTASRVGGIFVSTITVLILTFMMLVEGPVWAERYWSVLPDRHKKRNRDLANKMYGVVTGYINGQVLIAAIAASFAMIALIIAGSIFNVNSNPIPLAGVVFLLGLIPLIGNTLAAVIVVAISLFSSVPLAITMGVFFLIYQQVENATLQPYIQAKTNDMTPLLVFVAALMGAAVGGLFGAFIAIPTAACLKIILEDHIDRRKSSAQTKS